MRMFIFISRSRLKDDFLGIVVIAMISTTVLLTLQHFIPRPVFLYDTNLSGNTTCIETLNIYAGDLVRNVQINKTQLDVLQQSMCKYQTNMTQCFRISLTTEEQHMLENATAAKEIKSYINYVTKNIALHTDVNLMEQVSL